VGSLLLHNFWVRFYLVYLSVLLIAFVWDSLRPPPPRQDAPPAEPADRR
jgi:hypothetical protein